MQQDNDTKLMHKATKEVFSAKLWNAMYLPNQLSDLLPTDHVFHLLKTRQMEKRNENSLKRARMKDGCSTSLAEHHQPADICGL